MKKAKKPVDQLRPEYKRSDFDAMVRGKYVDHLRKSSNDTVRALPEIAKRAGSGPRRSR